MGLDMSLRKKTWIGNKWQKPSKQVKVIGKSEYGDEIKQKRVSEIVEEVAYWRKANAIHGWFVKNIQKGEDNCQEYYVPREQLEELLKLTEEVLKNSKLIKGKIQNGYVYSNGERTPEMEDGKIIEDPTVAKELLPTYEGFFFGSYDYDEYYYQDIKDTQKMLKKLLKEKGDFYYQSSW